jgi:hypothetical protein
VIERGEFWVIVDTGGPHDGEQADHPGQHGHQLGPDALRRAFDDGLAQVVEGLKAPSSRRRFQASLR